MIKLKSYIFVSYVRRGDMQLRDKISNIENRQLYRLNAEPTGRYIKGLNSLKLIVLLFFG